MTVIAAPTLVVGNTTTEGTASYVISSAVAPFAAFSTVTNGAKVRYVAIDAANFEEGRGVWTTSTNTLTRATILKTSAGDDQKIDWASGTRKIYIVPELEWFSFDDVGSLVLSVPFGIGNYLLSQSTGDLLIQESGTTRLTYDTSAASWIWPAGSLLTGPALDFTSIKKSGTEIGTAALLDHGTTNGKLVVLYNISAGSGLIAETGVFEHARIPRMGAAGASQTGTKGAVPAAAAGDQDKTLRGDATWRPIRTTAIEAWRTSWANNSNYTYTHGLGAYPDEYWIELECTTSEFGFAVGYRTRLNNTAGASTGGASIGAGVGVSDTLVYYDTGLNGISLTRRDTRVTQSITPASWKIRVGAKLYG